MSWVNGIHPQLRVPFQQLLALAQRVDPSARVSSARRSSSEQARLYRLYLAGRARYPVAPPGRSLHEQGRAIDLVARPEVLRWLGAIWKAAGGRWGGDFKSQPDDIHFEA